MRAVNRTGAKITKNLRFEIPGIILRPAFGFLGIFHLNRAGGIFHKDFARRYASRISSPERVISEKSGNRCLGKDFLRPIFAEGKGEGAFPTPQILSRGSRASRKPSPRRLKPKTVKKIANPGKVATWGATEIY